MSSEKESGGGEGEGEERKGEVEVTDFDYLQCSIPDLHGSPRGRLVPKHLIPRTLQHGFGVFQGVGNFGLNMEVAAWGLKEYVESGEANGTVLPLPRTARRLAWSSSPQRSVGHVLGTLHFNNGPPDPVCTRHTALRQLHRLQERGITVKSAFELEFMIFEDGDPDRPLGGGKKQYCNADMLDEHMDFFLDLMDSLRNSGLPVEFLNNEYDLGQYEITMTPTCGAESPDAVFLARYGIHAFCRRRGYQATFMTRPVLPQHSNGFHLNHSLWTQDGKDVFFDAEDQQKLSAFARHWIAGLLHHAPALCALLCPTVNCYQRFHDATSLAPSVIYWNLEDRRCSFRAKTSDSGAYLENRLPSSAVNPYLALAATLAAGLDGVDRQLQCPNPGPPAKGKEDESQLVPGSLSQALELLEKDSRLTEALGQKVVDYFIYVKREFEVKRFQNNTHSDMSRAQVFEMERKYYMPYL